MIITGDEVVVVAAAVRMSSILKRSLTHEREKG